MVLPYTRAPHQGGSGSPAGESPHAALLIHFDNVTLGMRSDLSKDLKALLDSDVIKGKVSVRRAYADWRRYPQYIVPLSEASVDLIFAPAYGSNKKNATDIRMAIDGIELVFVRPEIGTFILLTGDSDFSSLVLKLKEYGKYVIGVGMQESSSDILVQNCDEYYSYTSLTGLKKTSDLERVRRDPWNLVSDALNRMSSRGDVMRSDRLKQVMREIDPDFSESEIGFSKFSKFLVDAKGRGLVELRKAEAGQFEVAAPATGRTARQGSRGGQENQATAEAPARATDPSPRGSPRRRSPRRAGRTTRSGPDQRAKTRGEQKPDRGPIAPGDDGKAESSGGAAPPPDPAASVVPDQAASSVAPPAPEATEPEVAVEEIGPGQGRSAPNGRSGLRGGTTRRRDGDAPPAIFAGQAVRPPRSAKERESRARGRVADSADRRAARPDGPKRAPDRDPTPAQKPPQPRKGAPAGKPQPRRKDPPKAPAASPASSSPSPTGAFDARALRLPTDPDAVVRYLANRYKGVGAKTAEALVERFGPDVFRVLAEEPNALDGVIPAGRASQLRDAWTADYERRLGEKRAS